MYVCMYVRSVCVYVYMTIGIQKYHVVYIVLIHMPNFMRARAIKYMKYFYQKYAGWYQPDSEYLWACGKLGCGVGTGIAAFLG